MLTRRLEGQNYKFLGVMENAKQEDSLFFFGCVESVHEETLRYLLEPTF